ncbi:MAG: hypothetical protein Q9164_000617 [Protoblastenia rupestris]
MPPAQIVNDGLWHCLCPAASFQRARNPIILTLGLRALQRTNPSQHRQCSQTPAISQPIQWPTCKIKSYQTKRSLHDDFFQSQSNVKYERRDRGLQETYEDLWHMARKADYLKVQALVKYLVQECREKPNTRLYDALILANANAEYGSPAEVTTLMQEMAEEGITPDSATYHAILRVLAVHPDHLLRVHILSSLRERWFSLTKEGHHDLVVSLIRERQLELALQHLGQMEADEITVYPWLYDMMIYTLCNIGEIDEAVRLMQRRIDLGELMISGTVWYHLLDTASHAMHHSATLFAYNARVATSYLNPPSGICTNILTCAARHGDPRLATAAFSKLSERSGNPIQLHHYESLLEAYITAGDLRSSLILLTAMLSAGHLPTESSTRLIYMYLKRSRQHPDTAMEILEDLRDQDRPIPLEALNAVLQGYIHHSNLPAALQLYNSISLYTASPPTQSPQKPQKPLSPNTTTFNRLFRGCSQACDKAQAMFLASEMVALKVKPDALTYDRLILVCVGAEEGLMDAWRYADEMRDSGFEMRRGTAFALARRACQLGDERAWEMGKAKGGILDASRMERLVESHWREDVMEEQAGNEKEREIEGQVEEGGEWEVSTGEGQRKQVL